MKIIVNLISINENLRFQSYLSFFMINFYNFKIFKNKFYIELMFILGLKLKNTFFLMKITKPNYDHIFIKKFN